MYLQLLKEYISSPYDTAIYSLDYSNMDLDGEISKKQETLSN